MGTEEPDLAAVCERLRRARDEGLEPSFEHAFEKAWPLPADQSGRAIRAACEGIWRRAWFREPEPGAAAAVRLLSIAEEPDGPPARIVAFTRVVTSSHQGYTEFPGGLKSKVHTPAG